MVYVFRQELPTYRATVNIVAIQYAKGNRLYLLAQVTTLHECEYDKSSVFIQQFKVWT